MHGQHAGPSMHVFEAFLSSHGAGVFDRALRRYMRGSPDDGMIMSSGVADDGQEQRTISFSTEQQLRAFVQMIERRQP